MSSRPPVRSRMDTTRQRGVHTCGCTQLLLPVPGAGEAPVYLARLSRVYILLGAGRGAKEGDLA